MNYNIILTKRLNGMKQRCFNKNNPRYHIYGGRGISICDEWKNNTKSFIQWSLNNGFSPELTIDRIDNNGNYEPSNCRWITNRQNILESETYRRARGMSNYIGVWFRKDTGLWASEIRINNKKITLGCFEDDISAAAYRDLFLNINNIPYLQRNNIKCKNIKKIIYGTRQWSTQKLENLKLDYENKMSIPDIKIKYNSPDFRASRILNAIKYLESRDYIYP